MKPSEIRKEANQMRLFMFSGRRMVLRPFKRNSRYYRDPNYMRQNLALCGVLKKSETLDDFKKRWIKKVINRSKKKLTTL